MSRNISVAELTREDLGRQATVVTDGATIRGKLTAYSVSVRIGRREIERWHLDPIDGNTEVRDPSDWEPIAILTDGSVTIGGMTIKTMSLDIEDGDKER